MGETVTLGDICITRVHNPVLGRAGLRRYDGTVTFKAGNGEGAKLDYVHTFREAASVDEAIRHGAGALKYILERWSMAAQQVERESGR